jgi:hypothetical protein
VTGATRIMKGEMQGLEGKRTAERLSRTVLIVSLSLNVFVFACLAMYGTWFAAASLGSLWRGLIALFVWIATFGASTLAFWKVVEKISMEDTNV